MHLEIPKYYYPLYNGHLFNLNGTLANSVDFSKNILRLANLIKLHRGTLTLKQGAPGFLHYLSSKHKRIGIVSDIDEKLWEKYQKCEGITSETNGIYDIFSVFDAIKIAGTEKLKKSDLILETLDDWNMKNSKAIYYGGTLEDAAASHDAGVRFCLVGNPKKKELCEIAKITSYRINTFEDLCI